jgi:hypothetical protein
MVYNEGELTGRTSDSIWKPWVQFGSHCELSAGLKEISLVNLVPREIFIEKPRMRQVIPLT